MQQLTIWSEEAVFPAPADPDRVTLGIDHLNDSLRRLLEADEAPAAYAAVLEDTRVGEAMAALFGNSTFLARSAAAEPVFFTELMTRGPDAMLEQAGELPPCSAAEMTETDLMAALRKAKRRIALLTAVADISGEWPLERVTRVLSEFADRAVSAACRHLLIHAPGADILNGLEPSDPEPGSGLIVLGVGKLGANELNYSSDVDLIVLYDPAAIETDRPDELQRFFVRLSRDLVKMLSEPTRDGYVFRADLRLRPDPGSTPTAISVTAAETYYESVGQNWERAAMIKARQVAGDKEPGGRFLHHLQPFIWRRNLDFAAIQDIHSIKRQINAHRGGAKIKVPGHNVKLGRGGIREIEFFVQTQQLIWGGRDPSLRTPTTLGALQGLVAAGQVEDGVAEELTEAYVFLRRLEHRLQMVEDRQTHDLPGDDEGITEIATFMGFGNIDAFKSELLRILRTVESRYAELFEDEPALSVDAEVSGNLIFTGTEDDPDTMETLKSLGYTDPGRVAASIRAWHHARYRATRSERARQILTELVPLLLISFGKTPDPDAAFAGFDDILRGLPAGIQLFSMLWANPTLIDLIGEITGTAPRLAGHLGRHPALLESVLEADFRDQLPEETWLEADLRAAVGPLDNFEDALDAIQRWSNDRKFQIGVRCLLNLTTWDRAGADLAAAADVSLRVLQSAVEAEFAKSHGRIAGGELAIVALGKLGGREMTPTSDLDLVFVYDFDPGGEGSDGERSLSPGPYFARYAQRLITAITAPTAEGKLYEVDMRLRPSGTAGPIASSLEAFRQYHLDSAWTWEHLAISRARVLSGSGTIRGKIEDVIRETLTRKRDGESLVRDVAAMRRRIAEEHPAEVPWEVKHRRGGLVDVEFIIQYLQLRHGHAHPAVLAANTRRALENLHDEQVVPEADYRALGEALGLWQAVQGVFRLTIEGFLDDVITDSMPASLERILAGATGSETVDALLARMDETAGTVRDIYRRLIDAPAEAAGKDTP